jgi:hypothetical protein
MGVTWRGGQCGAMPPPPIFSVPKNSIGYRVKRKKLKNRVRIWEKVVGILMFGSNRSSPCF